MPNRILVALDNSSYADKVANYALDVAAKMGGTLFGIGVVEDSYIRELDENDPRSVLEYEYWKTSFQDTLNKCHDLAEARQQYFKIYTTQGNAAEEILKFAEKEGIDLIILGNLGRGAAAGAGFPIGSVAQKVAAFSKCPVLIVK
ncbi:MAG: universal stress protein [Syntrophomonadaceae bacterium]